ncbi:MAG: ferrous iron transport protein B [Bacteroidales bacterium]|nr:ferrous iron transport protein B [Bacteroidales bacterium]
MRLSELQTGEKAVIVKVLGHGGFRKRIVEMGFIRGQQVEALLNAPLHDPVKYRIMNYEVSLRREEAQLIEVTHQTLPDSPPAPPSQGGEYNDHPAGVTTPLPHREGQGESPEGVGLAGLISVALVGNPNCGKTSLFNYASGAHARVGNYSGVTVDAAEAHAEFEGYDFNLIDLPGTYSLSAYSPEELYVRKYIVDQTPDVIINVIDASNLERNLYLTTQLIDMNVRVVCALNMYDEFERRGDTLDLQVLSTLLGIPMVPTSFKTGRGVKELFRTVIDAYESDYGLRHIHIPHGHEVEHGIEAIQQLLKQNEDLRAHYSTRYLGIKLLENDKDIERFVQTLPNSKAIIEARDHAAERIMEETAQDSETTIMDAKYGFINGALKEAGYDVGTKEDTYRVTHSIDHLLSHRYFGFPIFFLILFVMFETTFVVGQYPMDWIEQGVEWLGTFVSGTMPDGMLKDMMVDGIIAGVGSVIVFLPQILILYFFISFMEDSGYMARAAFIMDKLMHRMGLHGKSFIPLIMGFGCNVPAVMATRTIESRRSRLITMMVLPFMSCSARLPIYIMITGIFFAQQWRPFVMMSLYVVGIVVSVIVSRILSRFVLRGEDTPFVMELPPYRWPTRKAIARHTWEKGKEYLKKMGGIILVASIIVWALGYFGTHGVAPSMEESLIGHIGQAVAPLFTLQGFNWQLDVSLIAGLGAKEIVASTIGVLGGLDGLTPLTAYCYLLFVLLYFPCIATIVAIKNETGSWRWAAVAAAYTTAVAWLVSAAVHQIGLLL